jgi:Fe2+ or Zn2+ uptake regulation protein
VNNAAVSEALIAGANELGFVSHQPVIEVHGICKGCRA